MNAPPTDEPARILVVGRSPSVLVATVDILRAKGYSADTTNQFDRVLDDYDVTGLDVLVFGGMVPVATKEYLREEVTKRNPGVTFVQGLAGIAGVIAAQVEAATSDGQRGTDGAEITYDAVNRCVRLTLRKPAHVTVEALWGTSFVPPEPKSTSMQVLDAGREVGSHTVPLPDRIPSRASFVTVTVDGLVRVFTVGAMPDSVALMVPASTDDRRLPEVGRITTNTDDH